jgi:glycolate oxidase
VRDVVRACYTHGVRVVPRGAGTGLSGGADAIDGCIVLALDRMMHRAVKDALDPKGILNPGKAW